MTAPPQVNGHTRPLPVVADWRTRFATPHPTPTDEAPPMHTPEPAAPAVDPVAEAEAEAIRARARAESEARRTAAEAQAEAIRIKAEAEAEKQRLANERAEMAMEEKRAAHAARLAAVEAEREETERKAAAARQAEQEQQEADIAAAEEIAKAAGKWRTYAIGFYAVCAVVALPVQIAAFWDPDAWWLVIAPLMLEAAALVVAKGAAAAVAARRPHWHYRTVAWMFAFIAAGINLWHGLAAFDPATAIGTAFASLAGPGVWDLHEHGRIRRRDGVPSRKERKAAEKAVKKQAAKKALQEEREANRETARQKAMEGIAQQLAQKREQEFPDEWKYALKLAVAMGETTVTDTVWDRAWDDLHAAKPGVTANSIGARNAAAARMARVLERDPAHTASKTTNAQRATHLPPTANKPRPKPVPPRRKRNDSAPFHPAAKRLAAETARKSMTARIDNEETR